MSSAGTAALSKSDRPASLGARQEEGERMP
jgi:hypothetical protein